MSDCRQQDWWTVERQLRIKMLQNQYRMELADEQLERGGNPIAAIVLLILIGVSTWGLLNLVLSFSDAIDGRPSIIVHEQARGGDGNE